MFTPAKTKDRMKIKKSPLLFAVNLLRHQIKMLKSGVADCIDDCHKFTDFYLLICAYLYGLFFINLPQADEFRFQRL